MLRITPAAGRTDGLIDFVHTETKPGHEGKGLARQVESGERVANTQCARELPSTASQGFGWRRQRLSRRCQRALLDSPTRMTCASASASVCVMVSIALLAPNRLKCSPAAL